jgi:hypothetical protein
MTIEAGPVNPSGQPPSRRRGWSQRGSAGTGWVMTREGYSATWAIRISTANPARWARVAQFVDAEQVQPPLQQLVEMGLGQTETCGGPGAAAAPALDRGLNGHCQLGAQAHVRRLLRRIRQGVPHAGKAVDWLLGHMLLPPATWRNLRAANAMSLRKVCCVFF